MATNNLKGRVARLARASSDDDFLVVILRSFSHTACLYARIGGKGGMEISQHAKESFDEFEARAIAAAKAAGDRCVAIEAYEPLEDVA